MISVIIATRNRPHKIIECVTSILINSDKLFEIIIVDQSTDNNTKDAINVIQSKKIKYFIMNAKGKSKALNLAISKAKGEILAFTDDDCIVDKNWLQNINDSFKKNSDIVGLFGKVLPYKPKKNKRKICPCTFTRKKKLLISKPMKHSKYIGFGNNMAYKREVFDKVGNFKNWLGPGSIGSNAEDAEFALRILLKRYKLLYNPHVKVYHNRWLTNDEFRKQQLSYSCGEVACYGYFSFQIKDFAKNVIKDNFTDSYRQMRNNIKSLIKLKRNSIREIYSTLEQLFFRIRGLLVAFYYSKRDPL